MIIVGVSLVMGYMDIGRDRSLFWIRIFENDGGGYSFLTTDIIYEFIAVLFPQLEELSPKGWTITRSNPFNKILWIPADKVNVHLIDAFISWAEEANSHIWLGKNKHIEDYFEDVVDCCIAADWNYDFQTNKRTLVGEAEYQIKYRYTKGYISDDDAEKQADILAEALLNCCKFIPIIIKRNLLVTTIPAVKDDQDKLSWSMARFIKEEYGGDFLTATLKNQKPKTKSLTVIDKVNIWKDIYINEGVSLSHNVKGKKVLIIDDLYQSGISVWSYAEYLKSLGALRVYGLVSVKSQRDSDNQ